MMTPLSDVVSASAEPPARQPAGPVVDRFVPPATMLSPGRARPLAPRQRLPGDARVGQPDGPFPSWRAGLAQKSHQDGVCCRMTGHLVSALFDPDVLDAAARLAARRHPGCHERQIAMYLCRVVLSLSYRSIGEGFDRDPTTVIHACAVVENRRDSRAYDGSIERLSRSLEAVFAPVGGADDRA